MTYIHESSSWRLRKRRRQQITLVGVLLLLLAAGGVAYGVYSGVFGSTDSVGVQSLPPCPAATVKALAPARVKVNVYNATKRVGLAKDASNALQARGFMVGTVDNDPMRAKVTGTAVVRYGPKGRAAATLVAAQVSGAKLVADKRTTTVVDLVLGAKYASLKAPGAPNATATPPACRTLTPGATTSPTSVLPKVTPGGKSIGPPPTTNR